jgi:Flp pilus assembly pilin Flp
MDRHAMRRFRGIGDLISDTEGATVIEFAFILTPLCMLLLGGLDVAYESYVRSVLQGALDDVTRSAAMEAPTFDCAGATLEAKMKCTVEDRVNAIARNGNYDLEVTNFYNFSGIGRSEKLITDQNGNGQYDPGDCWQNLDYEEEGANPEYDTDAGRDGVGGADDVVFYEMKLTMPRLFPVGKPLGLSGSYTITARAAVRNQPYSRQKVPPTVCK